MITPENDSSESFSGVRTPISEPTTNQLDERRIVSPEVTN
jgi:hypothetical protein